MKILNYSLLTLSALLCLFCLYACATAEERIAPRKSDLPGVPGAPYLSYAYYYEYDSAQLAQCGKLATIIARLAEDSLLQQHFYTRLTTGHVTLGGSPKLLYQQFANDTLPDGSRLEDKLALHGIEDMATFTGLVLQYRFHLPANYQLWRQGVKPMAGIEIGQGNILAFDSDGNQSIIPMDRQYPVIIIYTRNTRSFWPEDFHRFK